MKPTFTPGRNMAMKIPSHEYRQTVAFYRDILGLKELSSPDDETPRFSFGDKVLWLDCVPHLSQAELWLEVVTPDVEQAAAYLAEQGCARRDDIEPLPDGFQGFWVAGPSNIIHLVTTPDNI